MKTNTDSHCRKCGWLIRYELCGHQQCLVAYARGFCSTSCETAYDSKALDDTRATEKLKEAI